MDKVGQSWRMADLESRVVVVTGGAGRIGFGMVEAFLAAGARAVIADVDGEAKRATGAGRMIVDAVKTNAEWVFPGAGHHWPLLEMEVATLLEAMPAAP